MPNSQAVLSLVGSVLGLVGSGILAVSLNRILAALVLATGAHEITIAGLVDAGRSTPLVYITGTDAHVERGARAATTFTRLGLWLLVLGFVSQVGALLLPILR